MDIILASGSPRRINMMKEKGYDPMVFPADVNETLPFDMGMESSVMHLACKKALWVEKNIGSDIKEKKPVIIAADTIVYKNGIIGKPENEKDAFHTLLKLKNNWHYVTTGVCLLQAGTTKRCAFYEVTKVFFTDYSHEELSAYVKTDEPYDKAGGYAIQGTFANYIHHFEGDYDNVVGFPWSRIKEELKIFE